MITRLIIPIEEQDIGLGTEDEAVWRPSKVEHPQLVTPHDPHILSNRNLTRGYLCHANGDEAHQADQGIVGLDEDERTGGNRGNERERAQERG